MNDGISKGFSQDPESLKQKHHKVTEMVTLGLADFFQVA